MRMDSKDLQIAVLHQTSKEYHTEISVNVCVCVCDRQDGSCLKREKKKKRYMKRKKRASFK